MTQKELAKELESWFKQHLRDTENKSRNSVWVTLKSNLYKIGHWKDLPRGNPRKGYRCQQELKDVNDE